MSVNENNWLRYELERLNDNQEKIFEKIDKIHIDIATLKTSLKIQSSIWGIIGGAIPLCVTVIVKLFF